MPKFGDYFFTALIGLGGVVLFTGILIIVWIANVFFGFLPERWDIKPVTDNFKLVWLIGSSVFFLITIRATWKD